MSDVNQVHARLAQLEKLAKQLANSSARSDQDAAEMERLNRRAHDLEAQVTWTEGKGNEWTAERLRKHMTALEAERGNVDSHQQTLSELQVALRREQARLDRLEEIEPQANRLAKLLPRCKEVRGKVAWIEKVEHARRELVDLQNTQPDQVAAFREFQSLDAQVQARRRLQDEIIQIARRLEEILTRRPPDKQDKWSKMAFGDLARLKQRIGIKCKQLADLVADTQEEARKLEQRVAERRDEVQRIRERVATLKAEEHAESIKFQDEFEVSRWAAELAKLQVSEEEVEKVDGENDESLEMFLKRLQAEQSHLKWFSDIVREQTLEAR